MMGYFLGFLAALIVFKLFGLCVRYLVNASKKRDKLQRVTSESLALYDHSLVLSKTAVYEHQFNLLPHNSEEVKAACMTCKILANPSKIIGMMTQQSDEYRVRHMRRKVTQAQIKKVLNEKKAQDARWYKENR